MPRGWSVKPPNGTSSTLARIPVALEHLGRPRGCISWNTHEVDDRRAVDGVEVRHMEVALVHSEQARERRRDPGGAPVVAVYERSVAGRSGLLRGLWACRRWANPWAR